jgi:hypothetical protein
MMLKLLGNLSLTSSQFIPEAISVFFKKLWLYLGGSRRKEHLKTDNNSSYSEHVLTALIQMITHPLHILSRC